MRQSKLVQWLKACDGVTHVSDVTMTIGKATWRGARYTQRGEERYYLIGYLPAGYRRECFRRNLDDRDWYVAGYMQNMVDLQAPHHAHHPFGRHWIMMCWDHERLGGRIDRHDTKYLRKKVTFS